MSAKTATTRLMWRGLLRLLTGCAGARLVRARLVTPRRYTGDDACRSFLYRIAALHALSAQRLAFLARCTRELHEHGALSVLLPLGACTLLP